MISAAEKKTVLVVDDYYVVCSLLKNFLSDSGLNVVTCSNGTEGLKKAVQIKPDLIFLDLLMPDLDGIKMLTVIRNIVQLKTVPVVIVSANTNRTNVLSSIEAGADRVLSKPIRKEIILKTVKELLGIEISPDSWNNNEVNDILLMQELRRDFLKYFNSKKNEFLSALEHKSREALKKIIHDFKGVGSSIGCPELTSISSELQDDLINDKSDWNFIKLKCGKILSLVFEIENANGQSV